MATDEINTFRVITMIRIAGQYIPEWHMAAQGERGAAANRSSILWSLIIKRAIKVIRILWAPAIILIEVYCCRQASADSSCTLHSSGSSSGYS